MSGNTRKIVSVILFVVSLVALVVTWALRRGPSGPSSADRATYSAAKRAFDEVAADARAGFARGDDPVAIAKGAGDRALKSLQNVADRGGGLAGQALSRLLSTVRAFGEAGAASGRAADALNAAGGVEPGTLRSRADVDARLRLARAFQRAAGEQERLSRSLPQDAAAALAQQGVASGASRAMLAGFADHERQKLIVESAAAQRESADTAVQVLGFLQERWGDWKVKGDAVEVAPKHLQRFQALSEGLERAGKRLEAAQARLLAMQRDVFARGSKAFR